MMTDLHIQDWADLRVSTDPPSHVGWFLTSKWSILSTWSSAMKKCPFSMFFEKPAVEQSLVNFSCSRSSANFCSYSRNKFPCTPVSVWEIGLAVGNYVGITIDSKVSFAMGFPVPRGSLANSAHKSAAAPKKLSWLTGELVEEPIQWCHHYRWSEKILFLFLRFSILLFPRHWRHEM